MILRSITKHLKEQNWFAVGLDFFIVVVGILIAFQITNLSEAQQAKINEQAIINQLESEFIEIKTELLKQISVRETWINDLGKLITTLEGNTKEDDLIVRRGLDTATSVGRRPAQSAAYLQLMASGGLSLLSNEQLKQALVRYDVRLQRDAFIHPALMELVMKELSSNKFRDTNVLTRTRGAAEIDNNDEQNSTADDIRSYDLNGLKTIENRYESMYILHISLLTADEVQLGLASQILDQISKEVQ